MLLFWKNLEVNCNFVLISPSPPNQWLSYSTGSASSCPSVWRHLPPVDMEPSPASVCPSSNGFLSSGWELWRGPLPHPFKCTFLLGSYQLLFSLVQFSTYFPGYFDGQYWLWWVFLALGEFREGGGPVKSLVIRLLSVFSLLSRLPAVCQRVR